jgi:selenide,water dikinase
MVRSHRAASAVATRFGARAATDVTGFGLAGHLGEMLAASGVGARLRLDALPLLPGVGSLLRQGVRSTFHAQNAGGPNVRITPGAGGDALAEILFDPQTAGGLLVAFRPDVADAAVAALREVEPDVALIGEVCAGAGIDAG